MADAAYEELPQIGSMRDEELFAGPRWEIPPDGAALIEPRGEELAQWLRDAPREAAGWAFLVGGVPIRELREQARKAALDAGIRFAERFGLWQGADRHARFLVVTGHQPVFCHPGIWVKNALVDRLAAAVEGAVAINVVVDHDTAAEMGAWVPHVGPAGRLGRRFVDLMPVRYGQPFSQAPVPDRAALDSFVGRIAAAVGSLGACGQAMAERAQRFAQVGHAVQPASRNLAEWVTAARHALEEASPPGEVRYLEVPMADLAQSEPFLRLFAHIVLDARRFAELHNGVLHRYRRYRRVRSRANPFPDLAIRGLRVELPFWLLTPGERRRALHVEPADGGLLLSTADGPVAMVPLPGRNGPPAGPSSAVEQLVRFVRSEGLAVRPRAVALTLFVRLFVADLFVHGVGGGRYDRVTDALIRLYFGVRPLPFAVASMSLPLPLPFPAEADEVNALRRRLRELRFNPQRYVHELEPGSPEAEQAAALARQKLELVRAIREPGAPARALTRRIEEVNRQLAELLRQQRETTEARLRQAVEAMAEKQAAVYRGYPFFLYERERVWRPALAALEGIRLSARPGPAERR